MVSDNGIGGSDLVMSSRSVVPACSPADANSRAGGSVLATPGIFAGSQSGSVSLPLSIS